MLNLSILFDTFSQGLSLVSFKLKVAFIICSLSKLGDIKKFYYGVHVCCILLYISVDSFCRINFSSYLSCK